MAEPQFTTTSFKKGLGLADTRGWDTIYALKVPVLNDALRAHFKKKGDDATVVINSDDGKINAVVRDWQIVRGSGSENMKIAITFTSGDALVYGRHDREYHYDLAGASATATVRLGFHKPVSTIVETGDTEQHELKVALSDSIPQYAACSLVLPAPEPGSRETSQSAVRVEDLQNIVNKTAPDAEDEMNGRILGGLLKTWLAEHEHIFDFVFLSVDIAKNPPADFSWITPTYVTYAVADTIDPGITGVDNSIFAILGMTENRLAENLSTVIPAGAIPVNEGVNAAFLISPALVLEKIVQPNIHTLFGAPEDAFSISTDGLTLTNEKPLSFELHINEEWYRRDSPVEASIPAHQFSITLSGAELVQEFQQINFSYGTDDELNVQMSLGARSTLGLDDAGRFAMQMKPEPRQSMTASPKPEKVAKEMIQGVIFSMVATMVLSLGAEFIAARYAAGAAKAGATASTVVTSTENVANVAKNLAESQEGLLVEEATTAAGSVARTVTIEIPEVVSNVAANTVESELVTVAASEARAGSTWGFKNLLKLFLVKTLPMMAGNLAGQLWGQVSSFDMIDIYYTKPEKVPELALFGTHCVSSVAWGQQENARLICAGLNGAFVLGFSVKLADS